MVKEQNSYRRKYDTTDHTLKRKEELLVLTERCVDYAAGSFQF